MDLAKAAENQELPVCFLRHCRCGWFQNAAYGHAYIMGACEPMPVGNEVPADPKCPRCGKLTLPELGYEALKGRFLWVLWHLGGEFGRAGPGPFPCNCMQEPAPPCRLTGELEFKRSDCGDTVFQNDQEWYRISGTAICNGCGAQGKVALLEKVGYREFDQVFTHKIGKEPNLIWPRT